MKTAIVMLAAVLAATPASAQFGGALGKLNKAADTAEKAKGLKISEADERKIGDQVSLQIRDSFGVYQDKEVTKYVTLLGTLLAQASSRPTLNWEFIVLDTDGVNAFAAPGGIVHITRGALGLAKNEAELAGMLGHEITHVTEKHTINSIQKSNMVGIGTDQVGKGGLLQEAIAKVAEQAYKNVLNNKFDRNEENEADKLGIALANKAGYAPNGLGTLLTKISDRNKDQKEPNGMFASHPQLTDRVGKIKQTITTEKLTATAMVAARYTKTITFDAKPITAIAVIADGSRGLAGGSGSTAKKEDEKKDEKDTKKGGMFGGKLGLSKGSEAKSSQTVASAGARGGVPDRDAVGGPNKSKVNVTVTPGEVAAFKKGIA
ncbi:MAG: M48 family metalloprotease [Vicinamibacterales bacterium]